MNYAPPIIQCCNVEDASAIAQQIALWQAHAPIINYYLVAIPMHISMRSASAINSTTMKM